ncbi:aldo/keto reductase [Corynebacterium caspium]|uniref:aldo/keto reductase n=1 Tax=Corynebacterium caspium TaxID=234828 RepID=UPI00037560BC|nr:aldo/keto reductase [Corynebacterium caspium]WKD59286.1 General stress protein 69 [Corynebacterium caspium DSM 44850]
MEYRRVGTSGLRVSSLALGTAGWSQQVSEKQASEVLKCFTDAGGTLIDTSPAYNAGAAQAILGRVITDFRRDDLIISSSAGVDPRQPLGKRVNCSRRFLLSQLDETLKALNTDFIDMWSVGYWDRFVTLEEVCDTLDYAQRVGKVRYAGVRDFSGWQLALAHTSSEHPIVSVQAEYSLLRREAETDLFPAMEYLGTGFIAESPLAHGVLGINRGEALPSSPDAHVYHGQHTDILLEALHTAADGLGISPAVAAVAWVRDRPGISSVVVTPQTVAQWEQLAPVRTIRLPGAITTALADISR